MWCGGRVLAIRSHLPACTGSRISAAFAQPAVRPNGGAEVVRIRGDRAMRLAWRPSSAAGQQAGETAQGGDARRQGGHQPRQGARYRLRRPTGGSTVRTLDVAAPCLLVPVLQPRKGCFEVRDASAGTTFVSLLVRPASAPVGPPLPSLLLLPPPHTHPHARRTCRAPSPSSRRWTLTSWPRRWPTSCSTSSSRHDPCGPSALCCVEERTCGGGCAGPSWSI